MILNAIDTCRPRLSVSAAQRKRKETGDNRYYAPIERKHTPLSQRARDILEKPFKILFSEPMLIAITIYQSVSCASIHSIRCTLTGVPSLFLGEIAVPLLFFFYYFMLNLGPKMSVLALRCIPDRFLRGTRLVS